MASVHVIRLRGPWRYATASSRAAVEAAALTGKFTLPSTRKSSLGEEIVGEVCFHRAFNRPSNLQAEQVRLVIEPAAPLGAAWLNETRLAPVANAAEEASELRYEIAHLLVDRNELRLEMKLAATCSNNELVVGEVWLEIEEA